AKEVHEERRKESGADITVAGRMRALYNYEAPEINDSGQYTDRSDVYRFGQEPEFRPAITEVVQDLIRMVKVVKGATNK
ncbi:hypothetical protein BHM03_00005238, partial [Ensete ventricosum]